MTVKTACAPVSHLWRAGAGRACAAGRLIFGSAAFFSACEDGGDEDEERRPDGEGVVLLMDDSEKKKSVQREKAEHQMGGRGTEAEDVAGHIFAAAWSR